jgi:hypothetical protein
MISVKRFMKLNPSVKSVDHAKRLLKAIKESPRASLMDVVQYNREGNA